MGAFLTSSIGEVRTMIFQFQSKLNIPVLSIACNLFQREKSIVLIARIFNNHGRQASWQHWCSEKMSGGGEMLDCIGLDWRKFAEIVGNYIEWTPGLHYDNYCMMASRWNLLALQSFILTANSISKVLKLAFIPPTTA